MTQATEAKPHSRRRGRKLPPGITERISATTKEKSYQVRLRTGATANKAICRTFSSLDDARAWQVENLAKLNAHGRVATRAQRGITIDAAIQEYVDAEKVMNDKELQRLTMLADEFNGLAVMDLTVARLDAWKTELLKTEVSPDPRRKIVHPLYNGTRVRTYSESTVRKYFYTLKKVLEWHSVYRNYPFNSPFQHVSAPVENNSRTRRLEGDEEQRLLAACEKMYVNQEALRTIIQVALETAMRAGELLSLEWHEVDFSKRRIEIPKEKCKTKRYREVPMTSVCISLLKEYQQTHSKPDETRVFYQWEDSNVLGHRFKIITKNANTPDLRFHDLRHEATSRFYEKTDLRDTEIASITGHSDMRTLRRYANLRSNSLAARLW